MLALVERREDTKIPCATSLSCSARCSEALDTDLLCPGHRVSSLDTLAHFILTILCASVGRLNVYFTKLTLACADKSEILCTQEADFCSSVTVFNTQKGINN